MSEKWEDVVQDKGQKMRFKMSIDDAFKVLNIIVVWRETKKAVVTSKNKKCERRKY